MLLYLSPTCWFGQQQPARQRALSQNDIFSRNEEGSPSRQEQAPAQREVLLAGTISAARLYPWLRSGQEPAPQSCGGVLAGHQRYCALAPRDGSRPWRDCPAARRELGRESVPTLSFSPHE